MTATALDKYDAWAAEIQGQLAAYAKLRAQVRYFPLLAFVTAPVGLFWAPWAAVAIFVAWISLWGTTLYITHMKAWRFKQELAQLRVDAARMRESEA